MIGMIMSAAFSIYLLVPNFLTASPLATESYLILAAWSILGVLFFRSIFKKDKKRRLGKSTVVWIALLFLIFFISLLWMTQSTNTAVDKLTDNINTYHRETAMEAGMSEGAQHLVQTEEYINEQVGKMDSVLTRDSLIQMGLIIVTLIAMFSIYSVMQKREIDATSEKIEAEQRSKAKSSFLSNMSHDIRTPMNAITGYTALALAEPNVPDNVMDYLKKIDSSSQHLLALINDMLDMSRIESGKTDLDVSDNDISATVSNACEMFVTQMQVKRINYTVDVSGVTDKWVKCDSGRISRILLNLVSNAFKFTPERGSVGVTLKQTGSDGEKASYELRVKDTGIGMSKEFAEHVFEAFERERSSTVDEIQGTGLGMAITKSFVDLMGGTIDVNTKRGEGTEFVIKLTFDKGKEVAAEERSEATAHFSGVRLLLTDDNPINLEIAKMILSNAGFTVDTAENGQEALDAVKASAPGYYGAVLMDINMPVMNGLDASRAIRALDDAELANIPIIAMTASALSEDVQAALDAGMNAHVSKPIDINKLMATLSGILAK